MDGRARLGQGGVRIHARRVPEAPIAREKGIAMPTDFEDRARRIAERHVAVDETHPRPRGFLRPFWLIVGIAWGFVCSATVEYANVNYDRFVHGEEASAEQFETFAWLTFFTVGSYAVIAVLVVLGVLFLRRRRGLWNLLVGVVLGTAFSPYISPGLVAGFLGPGF